MIALPDAAEGRARLDRARDVIFGEHEDQSGSNAVYAVYVAVIAGATYGVPAVHALLTFVDPGWFAAHVTPVAGGLVAGGTLVALLLLVFWLGRVRGPVVPALPYLDLVATSSIDRSTSLAKPWRLSLFGTVAGGAVLGLVVSVAMLAADLAGPASLVIGLVGGAAFGLLVARSWLWGQVRSWPTGRRGPSTLLAARTSLRQLHISGLREQAASSVANGGSVLAGDLRAVRLNIAARSARAPRARGVRLRPGGPTAVVVRRDLLGLRRAPRAIVPGVLACAVGVAALAATVDHPGAPSLLALLSSVVAYLGFGVFAEGLRMQADNVGTVPLLGIDPQREALAHLVVPVTMYAATTVVVGVALVVGAGVQVAAVVWALLAAGVLAGGHLLAAFRGRAPSATLHRQAGVPVLILWLLYPLLAVAIAVTAATAVTHRSSVGGGSFALVLAFAFALVSFGRSRVRSLTEAHRG
ncbi:hypothetical protein [Segeticoccus rhizosphaerae]|uniref:hypothetical protein n=1 Tax=Segeticoccus rhizosphaerae TaxID=1104777 RepID=UPI0010C0A206|nr:hypothetical protein [Ornithinicoccus soli]